MKLKIFLIVFTVLINQFVVSQIKFEKAVNSLLQQSDYKNSTVGIHVVNLDNGESIYSLNSEKLMIPASTLKLVTSAAALENLGAEYRFKTRVGYIGETEKNVLDGDLVLIGGGDPVLGSGNFQNHYFLNNFLEVWARKIKELGIKKVNGDLILDGSIYDTEKIPSTWIWEDIGNYYGAGANAFSVYDNTFRITFRSGNKANKPTEIISVFPEIDGLKINNKVLSSDVKSDQAYVFGSPFDKTREIRGTIPKGKKAFTIKAAIHNPEEVLASDFLYFLEKEGILISGKVKFEKVNKKKFQTIYIQESPTLAEIIKVLNYKSVNLIAEHLVKQLAFEKYKIGAREKGIHIIKEYWNEQGLPMEYLFMEDGSGLSHFNAITPIFFTQLLQKMKNNPSFVESLPSAGDGTLNYVNKEDFPNNSLKAKTGSMTRIRCYAGYLDLASGRKIVFSIMLNNFSGSHAKLAKEVEKLLLELKNIK